MAPPAEPSVRLRKGGTPPDSLGPPPDAGEEGPAEWEEAFPEKGFPSSFPPGWSLPPEALAGSFPPAGATTTGCLIFILREEVELAAKLAELLDPVEEAGEAGREWEVEAVAAVAGGRGC